MESRITTESKTLTVNQMVDGHYKLIRPIGNGAKTANCWVAIDVNTIDHNAAASDESSGRLVAIKLCFQSSTLDIEEEQQLQDEFDAASQCQHPNLLPPEEYCIEGDNYYLVFPYTGKPSLQQIIGHTKTDQLARQLLGDLAAGLDALHNHQPQIIHNDIQPSNILVVDEETFALTNYGIHPESDQSQKERTTAYMAPEQAMATSKPMPESDVWALGATVYEFLTGKKPFGDEDGKNQNNDTPMPPLANQPADIKDLVYACLQSNPKKRPTAAQIKQTCTGKSQSQPKKKSPKQPINTPAGQGMSNKKIIYGIAAGVLLLVGVLAIIIKPRHPDIEPPVEPTEKTVMVNSYDKATRLLSDQSTAESGLALLDSMVAAHDARATFLMSRLYFDTRETDTVFYDPHWGQMRNNCGIVTNNDTAHKYLLDAFKQNENDFMTLYQLGCDFKAGDMRGCKRKLEYALWCFNQAESVLKKSGKLNDRYQQELDNGRDRISTDKYSPIKPQW